MRRVHIRYHTHLNGSINFTDTSWQLICPQRHFVAVVVLSVNLSLHTLRIKHIQLSGCVTIPKSYIFTKKSIMIGVNHTVQEVSSHHLDVGVICIRMYSDPHPNVYHLHHLGRSMKKFAEQILLYENTMQYLKVL